MGNAIAGVARSPFPLCSSPRCCRRRPRTQQRRRLLTFCALLLLPRPLWRRRRCVRRRSFSFVRSGKHPLFGYASNWDERTRYITCPASSAPSDFCPSSTRARSGILLAFSAAALDIRSSSRSPSSSSTSSAFPFSLLVLAPAPSLRSVSSPPAAAAASKEALCKGRREEERAC